MSFEGDARMHARENFSVFDIWFVVVII